MDLTVVGNGVAGSALTRLARERGHNVRLIGGPPSASLAALSVVRAAYVSSVPEAAARVEFAVEQYRAAGCQVISGALASSKQKPEPKLEKDWYAIEPGPFLLKPDRLVEVGPDYIDTGTMFTVHATGAAGLPGEATYGVTWVNADTSSLTFDGLRVYRFAPYRSVDAAAFRSGSRLGSSSSSTADGARQQSVKMFELADSLGWIGKHTGWYQIVARRVKRPELVRINGRHVEFGGFHRNGWALAPAAARDLLDQLEAANRK